MEPYSTEYSFVCVLKGETKHTEEIRKVIQNYVDEGLITVVKSSYTKNVHILTDEQWKEYKRLKKCREENLIGAGFP